MVFMAAFSEVYAHGPGILPRPAFATGTGHSI
jgi:hypothetical protein